MCAGLAAEGVWSGACCTRLLEVWVKCHVWLRFPIRVARFSLRYAAQMIHNFVIYHGYSSGIEYQDKTSWMGTGTACPSTTEMVSAAVPDAWVEAGRGRWG